MNPERFKQFTGLRYKHTKKDWIVSAFTLPLLAVIFNFLAFGTPYFLSAGKFIIATAISIAFGFLVHTCMIHLVHFWRRRFPSVQDTAKRYFFSVVSYSITSISLASLLVVIYNSYHFIGFTFSMGFFWLFVTVNIVAHVIIGTLYEFFYTMQKWKEEIQQNEQLEKEKLRSELAILKSQVNPHFLFNTLNTLSSLVNEDPGRAEGFIDEMSRVYRYLLRNNEDELSLLSEELKFIQSYFHLLKTRYGNGIEMDLRIQEHCMGHRLPPLTLQLLVENAVKHNIIKADEPLRIEIFTGDSSLTVRNKLQRKTISVHSTKVGLTNIITKYRLLKQEGVIVTDDGSIFSVSVPLIA